MRNRILITTCLFLGLTTVSMLGEENGWQATLRRELQTCSSRPDLGCFVFEFSVAAQTCFEVPARVATILENRQRKELLPYLSELRKSTNQVGKDVLDEWTTVVSKGLHGVPSTVTVGQGLKAEKIAVYDYSVSDIPDPPRR